MNQFVVVFLPVAKLALYSNNISTCLWHIYTHVVTPAGDNCDKVQLNTALMCVVCSLM